MDTDKITEAIIGSAYNVSNKLGVGFLEKVYENSMMVELAKHDVSVEQQVPIKVYYDEVEVGIYIADLIVGSRVIVELKAAKNIDEIHQAQLLNYLKATGFKVGLILNFGTTRLGIKRMVL